MFLKIKTHWWCEMLICYRRVSTKISVTEMLAQFSAVLATHVYPAVLQTTWLLSVRAATTGRLLLRDATKTAIPDDRNQQHTVLPRHHRRAASCRSGMLKLGWWRPLTDTRHQKTAVGWDSHASCQSDARQLHRQNLQCSWTSSLQLSADGPQSAALVIQPFQAVAEDVSFGHLVYSAV